MKRTARLTVRGSLLLSLAALSTALPAHAATSLKAAALQLSDVKSVYGSSYKQVTAAPIPPMSLTLSEAIGADAYYFDATGMTAAFHTSFSSTMGPRGSGPLTVSSVLASYSSASAAEGNMRRLLAHQSAVVKHFASLGSHVRVSALRGIGTDGITVSYVSTLLRSGTLTLVFHRSQYVMMIEVASPTTALPAGKSVLRLGGIADARLRRHG